MSCEILEFILFNVPFEVHDNSFVKNSMKKKHVTSILGLMWMRKK